MAKLYCISILQGPVTFYSASSKRWVICLKLSLLLGLVLFGNIADNLSQPRTLMLFTQISLSIYWTFTGLLARLYLQKEDTISKDQLEALRGNFFNDLNLA